MFGTSCPRSSGWLGLCIVWSCAFVSVGCSTKSVGYRENILHTASLATESTADEVLQIASKASGALEDILGDIDNPQWPPSVPCPVDMDKVRRAAGPVGRNKSKVEKGLYRKHCVQCHGLSGDGYGPAAGLLAPYPRDFRRGTFKFKSTPVGSKPTQSDIVR
ncbi:MAG: cytochrome c, partial [Pirellula sp.]